MKRINKSILAVVIGTVCAPALAELHGADLAAAQAYFAAHPDIPSDKETQILNADSLYAANNQLSGYSYHDQRTDKNIYPGLITPIADTTPTAIKQAETIPATEIKPAVTTGMTEEQGKALTDANIDRTAVQKAALKAAQLERFQQLKGESLTQANIDRTAVQKAALKAAQLERFQQLKGESLTQANIDRTAVQKAALKAAQLERFQQLKGESLTQANIDRTAVQKAALKAAQLERFQQLKGESLTQANIDRTAVQKAALKAAQLERFQQLKGESLTQANIDRTAVQKAALKAAQLERFQQLKGESLTQANIDRTAVQKAALKAAQLERFQQLKGESLTQANIDRTAVQKAALKAAQLERFQQLKGESLTQANIDRTALQHPDTFAIQAQATEQEQAERDAQQNTAINKAQRTASLASAKTDEVSNAINIAQAYIEGSAKQAAIQNGDRVQGMLHAKQNAETNATVNAAVDAVPTAKLVSNDVAANHSAIDANKATIKTTQGDVQKLAKQQQIQSVYYGEQIQTLAANQGEVVTAVNNNHAANRATQSQVDSNTQQLNKLNSNFSSLKNEVNDNKKQASAGVSGAMAQANIPQVLQGQTFAVGAGLGGYDGESAVAVGFSARVSQGVTVKATVSDDTAENVGYGAGVSVGW